MWLWKMRWQAWKTGKKQKVPLQQLAVDKLLEKWDGKKEDFAFIFFAGDLLGQLIATSFGLMQYEIPMFGLYGACSTFW